MPTIKFKNRYSLQVHITSLFTFLIIVSGLLLGWYSYYQFSQNMLNEGKTLFDNSSRQLVDKIHRESEHVHTMLKILNASDLTAINSKQEKITSLPVLSEMLKATNSLSALFIAYPNNDFFLYKKINSVHHSTNIPKDSYFMMTLRQSEKTQHYFYDIENNLLSMVDDPNYNLNIEKRPWYKRVQISDKYIITDPYLFHATKEFGVTLAVKDQINNSIIGADYTLSTLSNLLQEFRRYPSSERIVVNNTGKIIAYQNTDFLLSAQGKFDAFKNISELQHPALAHVFKNYSDQKGSVLFNYKGEDWLGKVSPLSDKQTLLLFQIVKTKELLANAYDLRQKSALIIILIILTTLPMAWYFARLISTPISELTKDLEKINNFDFSEQLHRKTPVKEIAALIQVTNNMKQTISHFQNLSASLVSKQSEQQLLNKISDECNNIPNSKGTLIIFNNNNNYQIKHSQLLALSSIENKQLYQQLSKLTMTCQSLSENLTSEQIPNDIKQIIDPYLVKSQPLCWQLIPMKNRSGEDLGLLAVLADPSSPLSRGKLKYAQAIASFSALSIQSQQLLAEQKQLLQSFILLIAGAIDSKSPYTGGHCARVPELTKMLSQAACTAQNVEFKDFDLSDEQWEELHIAAWLHDCGKIITPEHIVDKSTKLEAIYDRLNEVRMRFELLKSEAHTNYWKGLNENGDSQLLAQQRDQLLSELDQEFEFVAQCNIGGEFMSDDKIALLQRIARRTWKRTLSNKIGIAPHQANKIPDITLPVAEPILADKAEHLIDREHAELTEPGNEWGFDMKTPQYRSNRGELYNLSIKRGTLTEEDRFIINGHMVHTIVMLSKLPFPTHLKNVPTIAGGHHEKMDGTGYPRKIPASELPVTARIMVVADIFEALTASDRPYKERKTLSEAIKIMSFMVKDDHIDPALFKLFLTSEVYLQYAHQYLLPEQIDEVNINHYL
ncbi:metal-dependent phosphohydrolase [Psychromonas sp. psych-6C06]|uniref:HD domain-containing phosphohydrolase n=1 Tax=Psychromonas sp. psych-6C06 TaxID=2058089 RepID=UPI000C322536|nr:HD domain-containing phosphohydrolase [Psychromonas sp. psych-6C06]PKF61645.1 metal-dependent phosphohydrolase [Psychromonas sp. psych-6C06]